MFDFGFSELVVIGAVALVVLGPEKLPVVARTAGEWIGKAQRMVAQVKGDIEREAELAELKKIQEEAKSAADNLTKTIKGETDSLQSEVKQLENDVKGVENDINASAKTLPTAIRNSPKTRRVPLKAILSPSTRKCRPLTIRPVPRMTFTAGTGKIRPPTTPRTSLRSAIRRGRALTNSPSRSKNSRLSSATAHLSWAATTAVLRPVPVPTGSVFTVDD